MLQMERVQTWVLMMGGGSGVDVFLVRLHSASATPRHFREDLLRHIARKLRDTWIISLTPYLWW